MLSTQVKIEPHLIDGLRRLQATGLDLPLVPLNGNKQPLGDRWQQRPFTAGQLIESIESGGVQVPLKGKIKQIQPQGYGILTGQPLTIEGDRFYLMALDLDGASAIDKIEELSQGDFLPPTPAFTSGRSGRCQYLFLIPEACQEAIRSRKVKTGAIGEDGKTEQVEFRWRNMQSVLPPSVHPTTGQYRWVEGQAIDEVKMAIAPDWMLSVMSREQGRQGETGRISLPPPVSQSHPPRQWDDRDRALSYLDALAPARADDYDTWVAVGMALHSVDDSLFAEWDKWSQQSDKYQPGECERKWRSFSESKGVKLGTLGYLAKQDGWISPFKRNGTQHTLASRSPPNQRTLPPPQRSNMTEQPNQPLPIPEAIPAAASQEAATANEPVNEDWDWPYEDWGEAQVEAEYEAEYWAQVERETNQEKTMLIPDENKHDVRHIGRDMQKIEEESSLIALRLVKKILERLQFDPQLRNRLKVDLDKSTDIKIDLEGKTAFKGTQYGKNSVIERQDLAATDLDYISQALERQPGQATDLSRNLSIKINDQEVFRLRDGVVELNEIGNSQLGIDKKTNQTEAAVAEPAVFDSVAETAPEMPEKANFGDFLSQTQQAFSAEFDPAAAAMPDHNRDDARAAATNYQIVSEPQPVPDFLVDERGHVTPSTPTPDLSPDGTRESALPSPSSPFLSPPSSTLDAATRAQLQSLGVDVSAVEAATRQNPASPVIVVVGQQPTASPIQQSVEPAPRRAAGVKQVLGKVKDGLAKVGQTVGQTLGRAFDAIKQPFKQQAARQQDLSNLAAATTAQRLLHNFGQQQPDGSRSFEGNAYRYQQQGDRLTVSAKDGRGPILEFGGGTLQGNLSRGDRQSFQNLDRELDKVRRNSQVESRQESKKEEMALGD